MALSITSHRCDGQITVALVGEIDLLSAPELNAELTVAVQADDVTQICIDLSEVTFTDSTGVGSLIVGKQLATESGKLYEVVAADNLVRRVLDITGVWNYLSGEPD